MAALAQQNINNVYNVMQQQLNQLTVMMSAWHNNSIVRDTHDPSGMCTCMYILYSS